MSPAACREGPRAVPTRGHAGSIMGVHGVSCPLLITPLHELLVSSRPSLMVESASGLRRSPGSAVRGRRGEPAVGPDPARAEAIDSCDLVIRVNGFVCDEPAGRRPWGQRPRRGLQPRVARDEVACSRTTVRGCTSWSNPAGCTGSLRTSRSGGPPTWASCPCSTVRSRCRCRRRWGCRVAKRRRGDDRHDGGVDRPLLVPRRRPRASRVLVHDNPHQTSWKHAAGDSVHRRPRTPHRARR